MRSRSRRAPLREVDAPASLRARIEAQRRTQRSSRPSRLVWIGGLAAASVAAVAIGIAVAQTSSPRAGFRAALAATELAPGASADATLAKTDAGWRIELDATGLPRRDGGRFYEAWLKDAAGMLVPIGTFNEGGKVTLWAGVSPKDFTTLTVTRERADGDQESSGEKVLVGTVDCGGQAEPPSMRRTTCWRARYRRLMTVPSRIRSARAVSLYERPVTSTATRTSRKSSGSAAIAA